MIARAKRTMTADDIARLRARQHTEVSVVVRSVGRPRGVTDDMCRGSAARVRASDIEIVRRLFPSHLRRVREFAGVSVAELATAIDSSPSTIHAYERGPRVPSISMLIAISLALRVPLDHLIPGAP